MEESKIGPASVTGIEGVSASAAPPQKPRQAIWQQYVQRCAAGDDSALAALYDESSRLVYTMAFRILRDTADAEEVTLDVYMQVWRAAQSYSGNRGSVGTWLVMQARTRAIDRLRLRQSRGRLEDPLVEGTDSPAGALNPEEAAQSAWQRRRGVSALRALTP